MRRVTFARYETADKQAMSPKVFIYLWEAVRGYPSGDREQTKRGHAVWKALDDLTVRSMNENGESETVRLRSEGGELLLEAAEYSLLKTAWEKVRGNVPLGFSAQVMAVDALLDEAPEVSKEEIAKALAPESAAE